MAGAGSAGISCLMSTRSSWGEKTFEDMPRIIRRIKIKWMSCILARPTETARPDQSVS